MYFKNGNLYNSQNKVLINEEGNISVDVLKEQHNFTLGEDLLADDLVKIINDDSIMKLEPNDSTDLVTKGHGSVYEFNDGHSQLTDSVALEPNKVFMCYRDHPNSLAGTAMIVTINGTNITFGSEYVFKATESNFIRVDKINKNKVIIVYADGTSNGNTLIAEINGDIITFGSTYTFLSSNTAYCNCNLIDNNKVLINYNNYTTNNGYGVVATISGTVISFGTPFMYSPLANYTQSITLEKNKVLIVYYNVGNNKIISLILNISGLSITTSGVPYFYGSNTYVLLDIIKMNKNKVVFSFRNISDNYGTLMVLTINNDVITFNTPVTFNSALTYHVNILYLDVDKFITFYNDSASAGNGVYIICDIDGTVITFNSPVLINNDLTVQCYLGCSLETNKVYLTYNNGTLAKGRSLIYEEKLETTITKDDNIGILQETGSLGEYKPVTLKGDIHSFQNNLDYKKYYIKDGAMTNLKTDVPLGTKINSNQLKL
jgi:hypothetical protein